MNKPLEEHGKKAQDMLLKYDYVETLDEFADGIRTHDNLNTSQTFLWRSHLTARKRRKTG